jgi:hypothetical protein
MRKSRKLWAALGVVTLSLMTALLACTANDSLFIKLTPSPSPTITSTPLAFTTRYKVGDEVTIISSSTFLAVGLNSLASPYNAAEGVVQCLPGNTVVIADISGNVKDPTDKTIFYKVGSCNGLQGWLREFQVTTIKTGTALTIKSADGTGAAVYRQNDALKGTPLANKCADGTEVKVSEVATGKEREDNNVYYQIACGTTRGYILEKDVVLPN